MNDTAALSVSGLGKDFATASGTLQVLRNIDLTIGTGERVAVVGTSGAGKTTLMHILGGLERPSRGEVRFSGRPLSTLRGAALDEFRNRTIGFVFQFHQLLPEFTALENVMMPLLIAGIRRSPAQTRAAEILGEVGLEQRLTHKPGALSGGEQQRVAIARALVGNPRILLADEPTGNLDNTTSEDILRLLNQLHRQRDLTMVIVTHNRTLAASLDRVVTIDDGMLSEDLFV